MSSLLGYDKFSVYGRWKQRPESPDKFSERISELLSAWSVDCAEWGPWYLHHLNTWTELAASDKSGILQELKRSIDLAEPENGVSLILFSRPSTKSIRIRVDGCREGVIAGPNTVSITFPESDDRLNSLAVKPRPFHLIAASLAPDWLVLRDAAAETGSISGGTQPHVGPLLYLSSAKYKITSKPNNWTVRAIPTGVLISLADVDSEMRLRMPTDAEVEILRSTIQVVE